MPTYKFNWKRFVVMILVVLPVFFLLQDLFKVKKLDIFFYETKLTINQKNIINQTYDSQEWNQIALKQDIEKLFWPIKDPLNPGILYQYPFILCRENSKYPQRVIKKSEDKIMIQVLACPNFFLIEKQDANLGQTDFYGPFIYN